MSEKPEFFLWSLFQQLVRRNFAIGLAEYEAVRQALRAGYGLNPALVIAAGGAGLVWGGMARAFGGLAPSILAHALFDWAVLMMFPLWGGHR